MEIIARNTMGALRARLLVGDFHTYPQLYDRAAKVMRNREELPFLELEAKNRKKTAGHTIEDVTGNMAQLTTQNQRGWKGQHF